jgi:major membrane immunogen (membrane-anchored lipoprotein)
MKMKNYIVFLTPLFFYFGNFAQKQLPSDSKSVILEKTHWMIERSDINKVKTEFQEICNENHFSSIVKGLKDGTYKGATPADDYGYIHEVIFEIQNGKMVSLDYDEINSDGHAKQSNKEYCEQMLQSGTTPAIAYPKYETEMIVKQDFNLVDAVSGASYSLYRFKLAILYAILNSGQL